MNIEIAQGLNFSGLKYGLNCGKKKSIIKIRYG